MYFLTSSKNKFQEFEPHFPGLQMLSVDVPEIQSISPQAVMTAKANAALVIPGIDGGTHFAFDRLPMLVEDTSLGVHAMNGLPGPLIKWFIKSLGSGGLAQMVTTAYKDHSATALTLLAYVDGQGAMYFYEGEITGKIVMPRVSTDFAWDNIFVPDGYDLTFAEMPAEQKNEISMRRKAIDSLKKAMDKQ